MLGSFNVDQLDPTVVAVTVGSVTFLSVGSASTKATFSKLPHVAESVVSAGPPRHCGDPSQ